MPYAPEGATGIIIIINIIIINYATWSMTSPSKAEKNPQYPPLASFFH
jgi:hypothetical protein